MLRSSNCIFYAGFYSDVHYNNLLLLKIAQSTRQSPKVDFSNSAIYAYTTHINVCLSETNNVKQQYCSVANFHLKDCCYANFTYVE